MKETLKWNGDASELKSLTKDQLNNKFMQQIDDRYYPEIRRMERTVLLTQLDSAWKDHLLAMDHVRSSVNFRSMGQMDPKVEYKREGMRLFEQMWMSIGERMTDVIFRMEAMDSDMVADSWVETSATHESFDVTSELMAEKQADLAAAEQVSAEPAKPETIRNRQERAGRNDPCPCGSGKKYKTVASVSKCSTKYQCSIQIGFLGSWSHQTSVHPRKNRTLASPATIAHCFVA